MASLPSADRLPFWQEVICRSYVPLAIDVEISDPAKFSGVVETVHLGDLMIATTTSESSHVIRRTQRLIDHCDKSMLMVGRQVIGEGRVAQNGNAAALHPGDFVVWDTTLPYDISFTGPWKMQVFQFPRWRLDVSPAFPSQVCAHTFSARQPFFHGVSSYLDALSQGMSDAPGGHDAVTNRDVASRTSDLIVTAVEVFRRDVGGSGVSEDLRRRVLSFIDLNLGNPGLCLPFIAGAAGISTRQMHRLFANEDYTVGEMIRERRMLAIRRALSDPRHSGKTVASIAAKWGYSDPPHFTREFKRRFGTSPSEWRAASLTSDVADCSPLSALILPHGD